MGGASPAAARWGWSDDDDDKEEDRGPGTTSCCQTKRLMKNGQKLRPTAAAS